MRYPVNTVKALHTERGSYPIFFFLIWPTFNWMNIKNMKCFGVEYDLLPLSIREGDRVFVRCHMQLPK